MNEYHCDICDIKTSGLAQFEAHLKGDKHSKRAALFRGSKRTPPSTTSPPSSTQEYDSYLCKICNKQMNSDSTFRQHIEGSSHRKKMGRGSISPASTPAKSKVVHREELLEDDARSQSYYKNKYLKDVIFIGANEDIGLKLKTFFSDFKTK